MGLLTPVHEKIHREVIFDRRKERLISALVDAVPPNSKVLDVGCGNGEIGAGLRAAGHEVYGVETLERETCEIDYQIYDGETLPFDDGAYEWATIVDVLHHCADPGRVMAEALRVCSRGLIIKDHYSENKLDDFTLGLMDWAGNKQFGVGRFGEYLSRERWAGHWSQLGLSKAHLNESIDLYPAPLSWAFGRGLHFVVRLEA